MRNKGAHAGKGRPDLPQDMLALVSRVAVELVAGVAVGGFMGWMLDYWLGTLPLFLIVFLFLGMGAGLMNIWRAASGRGLKVGYFDDNRNAEGADKNSDSGGGLSGENPDDKRIN